MQVGARSYRVRATLQVHAWIVETTDDLYFRYPYRGPGHDVYTNVTYHNVDSSGNKGSCMVPVTVVDNQPPILQQGNCTSLAVSGVNDEGENYATQAGGGISIKFPSVWDNSLEDVPVWAFVGAENISSNVTFRFAMRAGRSTSTTIRFQATDSAGNQQSCNVTVAISEARSLVFEGSIGLAGPVSPTAFATMMVKASAVAAPQTRGATVLIKNYSLNAAGSLFLPGKITTSVLEQLRKSLGASLGLPAMAVTVGLAASTSGRRRLRFGTTTQGETASFSVVSPTYLKVLVNAGDGTFTANLMKHYQQVGPNKVNVWEVKLGLVKLKTSVSYIMTVRVDPLVNSDAAVQRMFNQTFANTTSLSRALQSVGMSNVVESNDLGSSYLYVAPQPEPEPSGSGSSSWSPPEPAPEPEYPTRGPTVALLQPTPSVPPDSTQPESMLVWWLIAVVTCALLVFCALVVFLRKRFAQQSGHRVISLPGYNDGLSVAVKPSKKIDPWSIGLRLPSRGSPGPRKATQSTNTGDFYEQRRNRKRAERLEVRTRKQKEKHDIVVAHTAAKRIQRQFRARRFVLSIVPSSLRIL